MGKRIILGTLLIPLAMVTIFVILPALGFDIEERFGETGIIVAVVAFAVIPMMVISFKIFKGPMKSFLGGGRERRFLQEHGIPAEGVIKAIGESSMGGTITVNDQPYLNLQLEVREGSHQPYLASLDTIIPRAQVPQFQPGAVIPLLIHPEDPTKIAINWQGSAKKEVPTYYGPGRTALDDKLIEEQGIDGRATIIAVEPTGRSKDFNPIVAITYEINPADGEVYSFTKELPMPTAKIQFIQSKVGQTYPTRIHPHDGTKINVMIT